MNSSKHTQGILHSIKRVSQDEAYSAPFDKQDGMIDVDLLEELRVALASRRTISREIQLKEGGSCLRKIQPRPSVDGFMKSVVITFSEINRGDNLEQRNQSSACNWVPFGQDMCKGLGRLTVREQQIIGLILEGRSSKVIAADLGVSQRTVENHRASIMRKTGAKSLPALCRIVYSSYN